MNSEFESFASEVIRHAIQCFPDTPRKRKTLIKLNSDKGFNIYLCPGLDSNQHAVSSTTTSRWLVYQFQHLGIVNTK